MTTPDPNQRAEGQLELPLEYHVYDHYTIKLSKGSIGEMEIVRTHTAKTVDDAITFVESLRDMFANRDDVQWQGDEVDERGLLFGLARGVVYEISVVPPLSEGLRGS
jgi:hypothetical protein